MLQQKVRLRAATPHIQPKIQTVQGDTGRKLVCVIEDYEIPTGASASFWAVKPSGKGIQNTATISGQEITITLTNQTLAERGWIACQLQITSDGQTVKTFKFCLDNKESLAGDWPPSENESTWLNNKLDEMQKQIDQAIAQTQAATSAANEATQEAKDSAADANAAADEARETVWNNKNLTNFTSAAVSEVTTAESAAVLTGIDGKTKQITTTGEQLLDLSGLSDNTIYGVKLTKNADESITLSGTATAEAAFSINMKTSGLKAGKYFVSGRVTGVQVRIAYQKNEGESYAYLNSGSSVDLDDFSSYHTILYQIIATSSFSGTTKVYPMLNIGESALPWEPYSGGIPAPNPDYPIPIQGIGGQTGDESFGFKSMVQSENLFEPIIPTYSAGGATVTNNGDGSYTITGSGNLTVIYTGVRRALDIVPFLKVGTLRLNVEKTMPLLQVIGYGSNQDSDRLFVLTPSNRQSYITENILQKIKGVSAVFYGNANATITPITVKPMLGYVENGAEFQPYLHSEIPITLSQPIFEGDKLMQIKAGQSYVDADGATQTADRDLWGVHHQNRVLKFDGTEIWNENGVVEGATKKRYTTAINGDDLERVVDSDIVNGKSNMFAPASAYVGYEGQTECFSVQNDRFSYLNVYCGFQTVDEWKNHLKTSNMFAVLKARAPYFEPFSDQTPFLNWHTPDGGCTITTDDPLEPIISAYTAQTPEGSYLLTGYVDGLAGRNNQATINSLSDQVLALTKKIKEVN